MKYNKALDMVLASMVKAHEGNTVLSAKLFAAAISAPDFKRGVMILEASNAGAEGAPVTAAKKPVKAAVKTAARKAVKAAEVEEDDDEFFDMGDESDLEDLVDGAEADGDEGDADLEDGEDHEADDGDDDDEEPPTLDKANFARVLASMTQRQAPRKAKR